MGDLSKNLSRHEMACECGCGFATADIELVAVMQESADHFNAKIRVSGPCRCLSHNETVQKKYNPDYVPFSSESRHMWGDATDYYLVGVTARELYDYLDEKYPNKYGIGLYSNRVHLDVRPIRARW